MSSVIASNIPSSISYEKLQEFFSFCGSIKTINLVSKGEKTLTYEIHFQLEKALTTALLLNDAELNGVSIKVEENKGDAPPKYGESGASKEVSDNKIQDESTTTGDSKYDDISQEEKPKYAIMAQLLALGYQVSDNLIEKAISFDKEKGYSGKFKSFLADLDAKYIHSSQPDSTANRGIEKAQSTLNDLTNSFNKSSYLSRLSQYFEKAANHPYGIKIHRFYESLAKDVREVHEEAKRLTELRKERDEQRKVDQSAANASAGAAINSAN